MADIARIEERLDRVAAGNTAVSDSMGGIVFQNMTEVMEFAKLMSLSGNAVPKHLQANPGMCLAVCIQAMEWRFSPFAVANKSYEVQNRLSFESQLVHAVIEQRAPIIGRLRHRFEGEGDARICIVWAKLRETGEELEYRSPAFSKILPKNSPLWKTKPDLQQYYNTSRDFCRAYFPDVLLGVYSEEELRDHVGPDNARDVNDRPSVGQRLKTGAKGRGFSASHVERETRGGVIEETTHHGDASQSTTKQDGTIARTGTSAETKPAVDDGQAGAMPVTESNSSQSATSTPAQTATDKPASMISPDHSDAGNLPLANADAEAVGHEPDRPAVESVSRPADGRSSAATSERMDATGGESATTSLPQGWASAYASALRRARTPERLKEYAKQFWAIHNGWDAHKNGPDAETAVAIFNAFKNNFGNREVIDDLLRELI